MNRLLVKNKPKDKFIIDTLLPYFVQHIEESESKGTVVSQISSMYVFPYRTNEGTKLGSLKEPGISWYFDKNGQKKVVSSGGYRILDDSVLPEKQAASFRKTFGEYCGITEFSDNAVIKDLLEKMSMETDYTSRWWTYAYDVFKLWRQEDLNSSLEKATEGMDNNKFLFLTDLEDELIGAVGKDEERIRRAINREKKKTADKISILEEKLNYVGTYSLDAVCLLDVN